MPAIPCVYKQIELINSRKQYWALVCPDLSAAAVDFGGIIGIIKQVTEPFVLIDEPPNVIDLDTAFSRMKDSAEKLKPKNIHIIMELP